MELMITDKNQVCFAKMAGWLLQEAMFRGGPSFAQRIGRQVYRGSTGEPPKIEDFFQKVMAIFFSFHVDALLRRTPLKTSLHKCATRLHKR